VSRLDQIQLDRRPALAAGLSLVLAAACWGIGTVVSKQAVAEVAPLMLLPIQLASSVVLLLVITRIRREPLPRGREGRLLARLGLLNPGLAYALSLTGLTGITASLAVLLWATEPIFILVLAALVLGDRIGRVIVVASATAIAGLVLVVAEPTTSGSAVGVALSVAGVVLAQQLHALAFSLVVVVLIAATGTPILPARMTMAGIASAVASGLLYYAFAYSFYISALRRVRASIAAASFYLIPVFGLAGGWLIGERLDARQWVGALVVVVAVAIITIRAARPADEMDPARQPSRAAASAQIAAAPRAEIRR
jgi:probable blue pigment (indigoidine) exporter